MSKNNFCLHALSERTQAFSAMTLLSWSFPFSAHSLTRRNGGPHVPRLPTASSPRFHNLPPQSLKMRPILAGSSRSRIGSTVSNSRFPPSVQLNRPAASACTAALSLSLSLSPALRRVLVSDRMGLTNQVSTGERARAHACVCVGVWVGVGVCVFVCVCV